MKDKIIKWLGYLWEKVKLIKKLKRYKCILIIINNDNSETIYLELEHRWNSSFRPQIRFFDSNDEGDGPRIIEGAGHSTVLPDREFPQENRPRDMNFEDIMPHILPFMEQIQHRMLNSESNDTLDFDAEPGLKAIVHGGNNLGRGLTFKGLVTTYLLKKPSHLILNTAVFDLAMF